MISVATSRQDYVVFNCLLESGSSIHTFNCLKYIDNCKIMIVKDHSSILLADRTRIQISGKWTCRVLGDVYYVSEIRNCLLSVRQIDRQGVQTSYCDGVCEMSERATGKLVLYCRIQEKWIVRDVPRAVQGAIRNRSSVVYGSFNIVTKRFSVKTCIEQCILQFITRFATGFGENRVDRI